MKSLPNNAESDEKARVQSELVTERGKLYGEWRLNHISLGKAWTALLQQHYQIELPHDLPGWMAALMTAQIKMGRIAVDGSFHQDNYPDIANYLLFCEKLQKDYVEDLELPQSQPGDGWSPDPDKALRFHPEVGCTCQTCTALRDRGYS